MIALSSDRMGLAAGQRHGGQQQVVCFAGGAVQGFATKAG